MDSSFKNFEANYSKMLDHNAGDVPFSLGVNEFSDLSESEFNQKYITKGLVIPHRKRLGYKIAMDEHGHDIVPEEPSDFKAFDVPISELPDYKNWYEEGYVTRPYDQG